MPNIVQKSGEQGDLGTLDIEFAVYSPEFNFSFNELHQTTCVVENSNRVRKAGMRSGRKNKFRHTKLLDAAETLEVWRLE